MSSSGLPTRSTLRPVPPRQLPSPTHPPASKRGVPPDAQLQPVTKRSSSLGRMSDSASFGSTPALPSPHHAGVRNSPPPHRRNSPAAAAPSNNTPPHNPCHRSNSSAGHSFSTTPSISSTLLHNEPSTAISSRSSKPQVQQRHHRTQPVQAGLSPSEEEAKTCGAGAGANNAAAPLLPSPPPPQEHEKRGSTSSALLQVFTPTSPGILVSFEAPPPDSKQPSAGPQKDEETAAAAGVEYKGDAGEAVPLRRTPLLLESLVSGVGLASPGGLLLPRQSGTGSMQWLGNHSASTAEAARSGQTPFPHSLTGAFGHTPGTTTTNTDGTGAGGESTGDEAVNAKEEEEEEEESNKTHDTKISNPPPLKPHLYSQEITPPSPQPVGSLPPHASPPPVAMRVTRAAAKTAGSLKGSSSHGTRLPMPILMEESGAAPEDLAGGFHAGAPACGSSCEALEGLRQGGPPPHGANVGSIGQTLSVQPAPLSTKAYHNNNTKAGRPGMFHSTTEAGSPHKPGGGGAPPQPQHSSNGIAKRRTAAGGRTGTGVSNVFCNRRSSTGDGAGSPVVRDYGRLCADTTTLEEMTLGVMGYGSPLKPPPPRGAAGTQGSSSGPTVSPQRQAPPLPKRRHSPPSNPHRLQTGTVSTAQLQSRMRGSAGPPMGVMGLCSNSASAILKGPTLGSGDNNHNTALRYASPLRNTTTTNTNTNSGRAGTGNTNRACSDSSLLLQAPHSNGTAIFSCFPKANGSEEDSRMEKSGGGGAACSTETPTTRTIPLPSKEPGPPGGARAAGADGQSGPEPAYARRRFRRDVEEGSSTAGVEAWVREAGLAAEQSRKENGSGTGAGASHTPPPTLLFAPSSTTMSTCSFTGTNVSTPCSNSPFGGGPGTNSSPYGKRKTSGSNPNPNNMNLNTFGSPTVSYFSHPSTRRASSNGTSGQPTPPRRTSSISPSHGNSSSGTAAGCTVEPALHVNPPPAAAEAGGSQTTTCTSPKGRPSSTTTTPIPRDSPSDCSATHPFERVEVLRRIEKEETRKIDPATTSSSSQKRSGAQEPKRLAEPPPPHQKPHPPPATAGGRERHGSGAGVEVPPRRGVPRGVGRRQGSLLNSTTNSGPASSRTVDNTSTISHGGTGGTMGESSTTSGGGGAAATPFAGLPRLIPTTSFVPALLPTNQRKHRIRMKTPTSATKASATARGAGGGRGAEPPGKRSSRSTVAHNTSSSDLLSSPLIKQTLRQRSSGADEEEEDGIATESSPVAHKAPDDTLQKSTAPPTPHDPFLDLGPATHDTQKEDQPNGSSFTHSPRSQLLRHDSPPPPPPLRSGGGGCGASGMQELSNLASATSAASGSHQKKKSGITALHSQQLQLQQQQHGHHYHVPNVGTNQGSLSSGSASGSPMAGRGGPGGVGSLSSGSPTSPITSASRSRLLQLAPCTAGSPGVPGQSQLIAGPTLIPASSLSPSISPPLFTPSSTLGADFNASGPVGPAHLPDFFVMDSSSLTPAGPAEDEDPVVGSGNGSGLAAPLLNVQGKQSSDSGSGCGSGPLIQLGARGGGSSRAGLPGRRPSQLSAPRTAGSFFQVDANGNNAAPGFPLFESPFTAAARAAATVGHATPPFSNTGSEQSPSQTGDQQQQQQLSVGVGAAVGGRFQRLQRNSVVQLVVNEPTVNDRDPFHGSPRDGVHGISINLLAAADGGESSGVYAQGTTRTTVYESEDGPSGAPSRSTTSTAHQESTNLLGASLGSATTGIRGLSGRSACEERFILYQQLHQQQQQCRPSRKLSGTTGSSIPALEEMTSLPDGRRPHSPEQHQRLPQGQQDSQRSSAQLILHGLASSTHERDRDRDKAGNFVGEPHRPSNNGPTSVSGRFASGRNSATTISLSVDEGGTGAGAGMLGAAQDRGEVPSGGGSHHTSGGGGGGGKRGSVFSHLSYSSGLNSSPSAQWWPMNTSQAGIGRSSAAPAGNKDEPPPRGPSSGNHLKAAFSGNRPGSGAVVSQHVLRHSGTGGGGATKVSGRTATFSRLQLSLMGSQKVFTKLSTSNSARISTDYGSGHMGGAGTVITTGTAGGTGTVTGMDTQDEPSRSITQCSALEGAAVSGASSAVPLALQRSASFRGVGPITSFPLGTQNNNNSSSLQHHVQTPPTLGPPSTQYLTPVGDDGASRGLSGGSSGVVLPEAVSFSHPTGTSTTNTSQQRAPLPGRGAAGGAFHVAQLASSQLVTTTTGSTDLGRAGGRQTSPNSGRIVPLVSDLDRSTNLLVTSTGGGAAGVWGGVGGPLHVSVGGASVGAEVPELPEEVGMYESPQLVFLPAYQRLQEKEATAEKEGGTSGAAATTPAAPCSAALLPLVPSACMKNIFGRIAATYNKDPGEELQACAKEGDHVGPDSKIAARLLLDAERLLMVSPHDEVVRYIQRPEKSKKGLQMQMQEISSESAAHSADAGGAQAYPNWDGGDDEEDDGACECDEYFIGKDYLGADCSRYHAHKMFRECLECHRRPACFLCLHCLEAFCPLHVPHHYAKDPDECTLYMNILDIMTGFDRIFWCEKCKRFTWKYTEVFDAFVDQIAYTRGTYFDDAVRDIHCVWYQTVLRAPGEGSSSDEDSDIDETEEANVLGAETEWVDAEGWQHVSDDENEAATACSPVRTGVHPSPGNLTATTAAEGGNAPSASAPGSPTSGELSGRMVAAHHLRRRTSERNAGIRKSSRSRHNSLSPMYELLHRSFRRGSSMRMSGELPSALSNAPPPPQPPQQHPHPHPPQALLPAPPLGMSGAAAAAAAAAPPTGAPPNHSCWGGTEAGGVGGSPTLARLSTHEFERRTSLPNAGAMSAVGAPVDVAARSINDSTPDDRASPPLANASTVAVLEDTTTEATLRRPEGTCGTGLGIGQPSSGAMTTTRGSCSPLLPDPVHPTQPLHPQEAQIIGSTTGGEEDMPVLGVGRAVSHLCAISASVQGWRTTQEDAEAVFIVGIPALGPTPESTTPGTSPTGTLPALSQPVPALETMQLAVYCVFDGHGGDAVAKLAAQNFEKHLRRAIARTRTDDIRARALLYVLEDESTHPPLFFQPSPQPFNSMYESSTRPFQSQPTLQSTASNNNNNTHTFHGDWMAASGAIGGAGAAVERAASPHGGRATEDTSRRDSAMLTDSIMRGSRMQMHICTEPVSPYMNGGGHSPGGSPVLPTSHYIQQQQQSAPMTVANLKQLTTAQQQASGLGKLLPSKVVEHTEPQTKANATSCRNKEGGGRESGKTRGETSATAEQLAVFDLIEQWQQQDTAKESTSPSCTFQCNPTNSSGLNVHRNTNNPNSNTHDGAGFLTYGSPLANSHTTNSLGRMGASGVPAGTLSGTTANENPFSPHSDSVHSPAGSGGGGGFGGGVPPTQVTRSEMELLRCYFASIMEDALLSLDKSLEVSEEGQRGDFNTVGCTACIVGITRNFILCANVGDSGAALYDEHQMDSISIKHRITDPEEKSRITSAGYLIRDNRIEGLLAVPRALGDFDFKQCGGRPAKEQAVIAVPHVTVRPVPSDGDGRWGVILACDGVWDTLTHHQVHHALTHTDADELVASSVTEAVIRGRELALERGMRKKKECLSVKGSSSPNHGGGQLPNATSNSYSGLNSPPPPPRATSAGAMPLSHPSSGVFAPADNFNIPLLVAATGIFAQSVAPADNTEGIGLDNCSLIVIQNQPQVGSDGTQKRRKKKRGSEGGEEEAARGRGGDRRGNPR